MTDQQTDGIGSLVTELEKAGAAPKAEALGKMARMLAKLFGVDEDEVAVLKAIPKAKSLKFVLPEKLSLVGTIPLTSTNALAARTVRDRRPDLINNFNASRHSTVFEAMPVMGRKKNELIYKIISAPILNGTQVLGVIQISRKGRSPADAGPDFTQKDLHTLTSLAPVLERFLKLCPAE